MGRHPTITRAQVREIDRVAVERYGIPGIVLMENASRGVADRAVTMLGTGTKSAVVICGSGNNGGDGFAVARHLHIRYIQTAIVLTRPPERYRGDAATNLRIVQAMGMAILDASVDPLRVLDRLKPHDLVVDALLGTGLEREVRPPLVGIIEWMNNQKAPVLAVDVPSGLDCDTGNPLGIAVRAVETVTFVMRKQGFLVPGAERYTGKVHVVDIGVPRELVVSLAWSL